MSEGNLSWKRLQDFSFKKLSLSKVFDSLELGQNRNGLASVKNMLVLKLPRVSLTYMVREKAR